MITGLRPASFENLQLGAGIFLKNFDCSAAANAEELRALVASALSSGAGVIGATRGGGTFQCRMDVRSLEADGLRVSVKGAEVNDGWTVRLTGSMLEVTPANFAAALMCADVTVKGSVTEIRARNAIAEDDYLPRLCWIGDTARGLVLIELTNALNMTGANFTFTDKGEGVLPFEFQAHQDPGDDGAHAPFRIIFFT